MKNTPPRIPEIGEFVRMTGRLVAVEESEPPPPPPPVKDYIFVETTSRAELRRNGKTLQSLQTLNDFYGHGTSVTSNISEMKEYAEREGITAESEVEVVVIEITKQIRCRPSREENFYDKSFVNFESIRTGCRRGLPDAEEKVVWSTKPSTHSD